MDKKYPNEMQGDSTLPPDYFSQPKSPWVEAFMPTRGLRYTYTRLQPGSDWILTEVAPIT